MLPTKLGRVAQRATCVNTSILPSTTAQRTTHCVAARHPGQRRHSSSKASCPPDSSANGGKAAPAAKAVPASTIVEPVLDSRNSKKIARTKRPSAAATPKQSDRFSTLPTVPSTQLIPAVDICVSNFFSLHRPLAVGTTIPPPSTSDAFNTIFETRSQRNPWENGNSAERRPEDVIYALQNTVDSLEREASGYREDVMRWEMMVHTTSESQEGTKHVDGVPRRRSFDELVSQFRPYEAPPPPEPLPDIPSGLEKKKASKARTGKMHPRQKAYSTTIIVTELTSEDGKRTYTAESTPIVPIRVPELSSTSSGAASTTSRLPFRFASRMQQRHRASLLRQRSEPIRAPGAQTFVKRLPYLRKGNMLLISVKRQRKLKMKKHKYKKLMKRTRNLRRRQDRL